VDHCFVRLLQYFLRGNKADFTRTTRLTRHFVKTSTKSRPAHNE